MDGTFAGKSELAAADVERVLPAGAHDRRWLACTKCIKCERKNIGLDQSRQNCNVRQSISRWQIARPRARPSDHRKPGVKSVLLFVLVGLGLADQIADLGDRTFQLIEQHLEFSAIDEHMVDTEAFVAFD
jgi:hypothetical protein